MRTPVAKRVLLVGWEAADWPTLRPLIDRGVMPTLARMLASGVSGNLAAIQPTLSSMLWTSLATGKRADKHRILSLFEPLPDCSGIQPVSSGSRACQAVWNILTAAELKSHIIGWPATSPAEAILGSMAGDRFFVNDAGGGFDSHDQLCYPSDKADEWRSLKATGAEAISQTPIGVAEIAAAALSVHAVACRQIESDPWDFAAVLYPTPAASLPHPPAGVDAANDCAAEEAWRFQDQLLAQLLARAGEETTLLLISPLAVGAAHEATIGRFGMTCLAGPGVRAGAPLQGATILDVAPTILSLLGLPIGDDMDGWPWLQVLQNPPKLRRTATWELIAPRPDAASTVQPADEPTSDSDQICEVVLRYQKVNLALALDDSKRRRQAITLWKELVADHPDHVEFSVRLISSLLRNEEFCDCRKFIEELPPEIAGLPEVRLTLAELYNRDRQSCEAIQIAVEQASQTTLPPALLNRAGAILLRCHAWEYAQAAFLRSLALQAANPLARNGLATIYCEADRYDEAISEVQLALQTVPAFPPARFTLASCLHKLGDETAAIQEYEYCLSMEYELPETHGRLAALYRFRDPLRAKEHRIAAGFA